MNPQDSIADPHRKCPQYRGWHLSSSPFILIQSWSNLMSIGRSVSAWLMGIMAVRLLAVAPVLGGDPVVIVSVKPFKELVSDTQYLATVTNQPQLGTVLPMLLAQAFGGQPPKGFDASK